MWSYAIQHRDLKRTRELLTLNARLRQRLGPFAAFGDGERVDSYAQLEAQHFDFDPLTVARAHSRGKVDAMTHAEMKRRYLTLLRYLAHKPRAEWSLYDHLGVTYYLVKQGRIDEAVSAFKGATAIAQKPVSVEETQRAISIMITSALISRSLRET